MENFQGKSTKLEKIMLLSLINNRLTKKITESTYYRSIHLLYMFSKIFVSKIDKKSSLKLTSKKIPAKQLPACAFRAVAKMKSLGGKRPNFNKGSPKF